MFYDFFMNQDLSKDEDWLDQVKEEENESQNDSNQLL